MSEEHITMSQCEHVVNIQCYNFFRVPTQTLERTARSIIVYALLVRHGMRSPKQERYLTGSVLLASAR